MNSLPYNKTMTWSKKLFPYSPAVFKAMRQVLVGYDGLGLFVDHLYKYYEESGMTPKPPRQGATLDVLNHIMWRTLPFKKVLEFVTWEDIIKGDPARGIRGSGYKRDVINSVLKYFSQVEPVLLRIKLLDREAVTPLYGLNLYIVFGGLYANWISLLEKEGKETPSVFHAKTALDIAWMIIRFVDGSTEHIFKEIQKFRRPLKDMDSYVDRMADTIDCAHANALLREFDDDYELKRDERFHAYFVGEKPKDPRPDAIERAKSKKLPLMEASQNPEDREDILRAWIQESPTLFECLKLEKIRDPINNLASVRDKIISFRRMVKEERGTSRKTTDDELMAYVSKRLHYLQSKKDVQDSVIR